METNSNEQIIKRLRQLKTDRMHAKIRLHAFKQQQPINVNSVKHEEIIISAYDAKIVELKKKYTPTLIQKHDIHNNLISEREAIK